MLVLGGLYILLDLLSTLVFMNYRAEYETAILLAITIAYLFDCYAAIYPVLLCLHHIRRKAKENRWNLSCVYCDHSGALLLIMGNIKSGWFFYFDESGTFVTGFRIYFSLYLCPCLCSACYCFCHQKPGRKYYPEDGDRGRISGA